jgi:hypothetical protein
MLIGIKIRSMGMPPETKKGIPAPSSSRVQGNLTLINAPIPQWFFQYLVLRIIASFLILNHPERFL